MSMVLFSVPQVRGAVTSGVEIEVTIVTVTGSSTDSTSLTMSLKTDEHPSFRAHNLYLCLFL